MKNSLTYIISSRDGVNSLASAHNFSIVLNRLPNNLRFKCKVKSFYLNQGSIDNVFAGLHQIILTSNNLVNSGCIQSGNRSSNIIAFCDLETGSNNNVDNEFIIDNFNGRIINFTLCDETLTPIDIAIINQNAVNTSWLLMLELVPLDN
jgi:hypothetical protein